MGSRPIRRRSRRRFGANQPYIPAMSKAMSAWNFRKVNSDNAAIVRMVQALDQKVDVKTSQISKALHAVAAKNEDTSEKAITAIEALTYTIKKNGENDEQGKDVADGTVMQ